MIFRPRTRKSSMPISMEAGRKDDELGDLIYTHQAAQLYDESFRRLPQRLQLVKPIDGSQALERWQKLAAPSSLANALFEEPLHGITARGSGPVSHRNENVTFPLENLPVAPLSFPKLILRKRIKLPSVRASRISHMTVGFAYPLFIFLFKS
ncbi:hypothetical protein Ciccas_002013 [Cichlidogyrus casuarinus]|uniref:Uncharacterized protein n=1 Tax=Cichlidogyrus casuarinus TaxID=1844966 RepID=A0ABD2QIN2_9PLAT